MDGYELKFGGHKKKQRAFKRVCLIIAVVGAIGTIVAASAIPATVRFFGTSGTMAGDRFELVQLLQAYKRSWQPTDRAEVVEQAQQTDGRLDNAFHWLLTMTQHELQPEALELVAALKVQAVLADVQALRRNKKLAARALVAQDSIDPLPQSEIDDAAQERDKAMQLAVLQVAQKRTPPLLPTMLDLLQAAVDKDVRDAVMAALPGQLPQDLVPRLRALASDASTDVAIAGLSALGRVPMTDEIELFLAEQGDSADLTVARAALAALANRGGRLAANTAHQLWQVVGTPDCDRGIMARVFLCLERTKSSTAAEALAQAASLDEFGRYFAARIAISAGDQGGIDLMLPLCDSSDKPIRFAARGLLAGLAKSPASAEETWRSFFADHQWTTPTELPKPLLDL
jgi:hypothetical protein